MNVKHKLIKKTYTTLSREELTSLSKDELIDRIKQLEAQNTQLKSLLNQTMSRNVHNKPQKKPFNFEKVSKRHILLKFYYLGWDYQGYVTQEWTNNTIEHNLFQALTKCCLIKSRETSNYHRCGRTDKGVSAFCQVISIDVRSKLKSPTEHNMAEELNYCTMLNRILPKNIRAYAWTHVPQARSARFDCCSRTYKYYFPQSDLNVSSMREGCELFAGEHDFRNFCKMDVGNGVTSFDRVISSVKIEEVSSGMLALVIKANGFLWHQIRCIMAILVLVGQERESPSVISDLLDVERNPCKPQYHLASEVPLNLFRCEYQLDGEWFVDETNLKEVLKSLHGECGFLTIKTTMMSEMLRELQGLGHAGSVFDTDLLMEGVKPKSYKRLLERDTCLSLENRIQYYVKRKKLVAEETS